MHTREDKGGCGSDEAEEGRDFISIKHRGGRHGARSLDLGVNGKEINRNRCKTGQIWKTEGLRGERGTDLREAETIAAAAAVHEREKNRQRGLLSGEENRCEASQNAEDVALGHLSLHRDLFNITFSNITSSVRRKMVNP